MRGSKCDPIFFTLGLRSPTLSPWFFARFRGFGFFSSEMAATTPFAALRSSVASRFAISQRHHHNLRRHLLRFSQTASCSPERVQLSDRSNGQTLTVAPPAGSNGVIAIEYAELDLVDKVCDEVGHVRIRPHVNPLNSFFCVTLSHHPAALPFCYTLSFVSKLCEMLVWYLILGTCWSSRLEPSVQRCCFASHGRHWMWLVCYISLMHIMHLFHNDILSASLYSAYSAQLIVVRKLMLGSGRFLLWLAKRNPDSANYLGLEIRHKVWINSCFYPFGIQQLYVCMYVCMYVYVWSLLQWKFPYLWRFLLMWWFYGLPVRSWLSVLSIGLLSWAFIICRYSSCDT